MLEHEEQSTPQAPNEPVLPEVAPVLAAETAPVVVSDGLATPQEHGEATGQFFKRPAFVGGNTQGAKPEYRAAEVLHGWSTHSLHDAKPLRITRADFELALKSAMTADERGNYTPHRAACSPYCPFLPAAQE